LFCGVSHSQDGENGRGYKYGKATDVVAVVALCKDFFFKAHLHTIEIHNPSILFILVHVSKLTVRSRFIISGKQKRSENISLTEIKLIYYHVLHRRSCPGTGQTHQ
jgi:hypothetical protein